MSDFKLRGKNRNVIIENTSKMNIVELKKLTLFDDVDNIRLLRTSRGIRGGCKKCSDKY
jgi:hypothetical protein